jgi:hypothetical protein
MPMTLYWPGPSFWIILWHYISMFIISFNWFGTHSIGYINIWSISISISSWSWIDFGLFIINYSFLLAIAKAITFFSSNIIYKLTFNIVAPRWWGCVVISQHQFITESEWSCSLCKASLNIIEFFAASLNTQFYSGGLSCWNRRARLNEYSCLLWELFIGEATTLS